ncbi:MAG TPA: hypothetical protein VF522_13150 [Ramlibacter sp.]|uniref:hypothetical protein n=1 Tax=Ramlibacter sp. TaxID=1917967 RepID=UPI002ED507CD
MSAFGARGTGKTAWCRQEIERQLRAMKVPRLLVWDFKHDPGLEGVGQPVHTINDLARLAKAPSFRLRYMVDHTKDVHEQFKLFCLIAWIAGCLLMFVDELPEVTQASRAPAEWRRCVNVGRDYVQAGQRKWLAILAAGQRLAETDKSFIDNCDVVHCGRLGAGDARTLGSMWGADPKRFVALPDLHWIEKRASSIELVQGVLTFGDGKKTTNKAAKKAAAKKVRPPRSAP